MLFLLGIFWHFIRDSLTSGKLLKIVKLYYENSLFAQLLANIIGLLSELFARPYPNRIDHIQQAMKKI